MPWKRLRPAAAQRLFDQEAGIGPPPLVASNLAWNAARRRARVESEGDAIVGHFADDSHHSETKPCAPLGRFQAALSGYRNSNRGAVHPGKIGGAAKVCFTKV
jgi:hypothetical protein